MSLITTLLNIFWILQFSRIHKYFGKGNQTVNQILARFQTLFQTTYNFRWQVVTADPFGTVLWLPSSNKVWKNKSPKANHWVVKSCLIYQSIWFHPDVRYSRAKIVLNELQEDIYESGPDNMSVDEWRTFARKPHWMVSLWSSAWIMIRRWSMISLLESVRDCRQSFFVLS